MHERVYGVLLLRILLILLDILISNKLRIKDSEEWQGGRMPT